MGPRPPIGSLRLLQLQRRAAPAPVSPSGARAEELARAVLGLSRPDCVDPVRAVSCAPRRIGERSMLPARLMTGHSALWRSAACMRGARQSGQRLLTRRRGAASGLESPRSALSSGFSPCTWTISARSAAGQYPVALRWVGAMRWAPASPHESQEPLNVTTGLGRARPNVPPPARAATGVSWLLVLGVGGSRALAPCPSARRTIAESLRPL